MKRLFSLLALAALGAGCTPSVMIVPSYIQNVGVALVQNQTSQYGLDTLFTQQLIQGFQTDGRLPIANPDRADLVVQVTIKKYDAIPILFDPKTNNVLQYRLSLTYDMVAQDKRLNKILVEDKDKVRSYFYYTTLYTGAISYTDTQALSNLADDLSHAIIRRVLEGN
ncbi:MAG TPA: LPS assembly lipoprotein LptE [bacterium]|nr:LPS assembly lipoprotein LptE [bacterium]